MEIIYILTGIAIGGIAAWLIVTLTTKPQDDVSLQQTAEIMKLGKQLKNSYSVENMKKALESLKIQSTNI